MSGYASSPSSTYVALVPRIWVLYDHDRWKKEIKKFVGELEWLKHEGFGPVEIRKGSPRLATLNPPLFVEGLPMHPDQGFALPGDVCLYLHAELRPDTSAVGLLCCATVTKKGAVCGQRISRIGGMVSIDSQRKLAITTAHGMLKLAWDSFIDLEPETEEDIDSAGSPPSDDCYESDDSSSFGDTAWAEVTWPAMPSSFNPQQVHQWEPVEILGATSFLGSESLEEESSMLGIRGMKSQKEDTDFSLWGISKADVLRNEYLVWDTPGQKVRRVADSSDITKSAASIDVNLLIGPEESLQVQLLPGKSHFMVRGVRFTGKKIRTKAPLGMLHIQF